jgi:hypothetical protein
MSLETAIQNLADANLKLAAAVETFVRSAIEQGAPLPVDLVASGALSPAPEAPKRGRGRPPKAAPVAASAEFPSEDVDVKPDPVVAAAAAAGIAQMRETPAVNAIGTGKPEPGATFIGTTAGGLTMVEVRKALIEVVKEKGKEACGALCRAHGGPNLSAIDPKQYPALHAAAIALLATGEG